MSLGLNDIASVFCKGDGKDGKGNNIFLWVLIILVICGCGGKSFLGGYGNDPCGSYRRCGGKNNGFGGSWVIILVILLVLCGDKGFAGLGGQSGNLNTNIINVDREDYYDDY